MTGLYEIPAQTRARAPLALLLGLCALALAAVAAVNVRVDPVGLFDDGRLARAAAKTLIEGKAIAASNLDDRQLHRAYAREVPAAPDTLVLGSSRTMAVSAEMVGGVTAYNASVSSATLPDLLAVIELFLAADKKPKRVVIGLDTWLLDSRPRNSRWRALAPQYAALRDRLGLPKRDVEVASRWSRLKAIVGLSMTLESLGVLRADGVGALAGRRGGGVQVVPAGDTSRAAKRPDGSLRYAASYRDRSVALVRAAAVVDGRQLVTDSLRQGSFAPAQVAEFAALISHLKRQGVEVVFVLPPFHPTTYAWVRQRSDADFLAATEKRYRALAERLGVPVVGSYNPARAGCPAGQFLDGSHAKGACMRKVVRGAVIPRGDR